MHTAFRIAATTAAAALIATAGLAMLAPTAGASMQQDGRPAPTLKPGDDAPAVEVSAFVKGTPFDKFEPGHVYVVEFWATWCPPCIKAFPHLSELQAEHGDKVTFMGVNVWERIKDPQKRDEHVRKFIADQGDNMAYTVVMDKNDAMATNWMTAAGQNGIPCSFIVDQQGKVAWIGHPMDMDGPLEKVIAGEWNMEMAAQAQAEQQEALAVQQKAEALMTQAQAAYQSGDIEGVLGKLDEIVALDPEAFAQAAISKFQILALQLNDYPKAFAYMRGLSENQFKDSPQLLNGFAFFLMTDGSLNQRDPKLALDMAERAANLTNNADADVMDTLAMARDANGDTAGAIAAATIAVELAGDDTERAAYQNNLDLYKSKAEG